MQLLNLQLYNVGNLKNSNFFSYIFNLIFSE